MANTPRSSGVFNLGALGGDGAASGDPHWSNVSLLLDNTNTTPTDLSTNQHSGISLASGTITAGSTNGSSVPHPYGSTADYLDFSSARVNLPSSVDLSGGDWTIECWASFDATTHYNSLFSSGSGGWQLHFNNNNQLEYSGSSSALTNTNVSISTNTWYFVSLSYVSATQTLYLGVNGSVVSSSNSQWATMTANYMGGSGDTMRIASNRDGSRKHDGKMSDIRFTAGVARYTGSFTPPTEALPQGAGVAATRPTRRWGGITGRSLVETTTSAAPLWTPDDVTNTAAPAIWLDASTSLTTNKGSLSTTVTLGSGAWSSSGTQNGLTTAINSAAGTVEPITFTGTAVASVAMLYKWDSAGASRSYATTFSGSTAADYTFMGGYGSAVLHTYGSADSHNWDHVREDGVEYSTSHTTAAAWSTRTTDWMLHVFVLNGTRTATINRWGYERTNAGRHFTGELAEVMAFPGKLSQSECEQVEGYLAHKWGLASLLPSAHSYKSAAPTSGTGSPSTNVPTTGVLSLPELLQARYGLGASVSIDVLVVGGGSGQGGHNDNNYYVAGGNAGDVTRRTAYAVTLGSPIAITIGAGSASGADGQNVATDSAQGGQTAFGSLTADGGHGSPGDLSQATSVTYDNTTTIDIDGTVTNYSMGAWASGTNAVGGSGAGGDGSGTAGSSSGGAGYTYQVNSTTVDTVSQGGDWLTTQTGTNHAATEYGSGGQGGYDSEAVGIDGVVYAAYPTGTVNSYTWSGAAGDINKDTSTVSGYTILRFTGNGDWTPSAVAVSLSADVLVVGGGAGGAEADISVTVGNGGSGGAVTLASAYDLGTSAITISVGAGGTAPQDSNYNDPGGAGGQSAFGVITAAGAPQNVMFSTATSQQTSFTNYGGSTTTYTTTESGAGTQSGVPYDGLNGAGAGGDATTTAGGNGYLWSVTNTRYGAGGGAARFNNSTRYVGGSGGGGSGGYSSGASYYAATAATGYGSGGGGGYLTGYPSDGTAGVVLVYLSGTTYTLSEAQAAFTGSNSDVAVSTPAGGGTLITFTGNGDWTPPTA